MSDRPRLPRFELQRLVSQAGGIESVAVRFDVSPAFVRDVLTGRHPLPESWLDRRGMLSRGKHAD